MDIKIRLYSCNSRLSNRTRCYLEIPLYCRYVWWRCLLFYFYYIHYFYWVTYIVGRVFNWTWFPKRCHQIIQDICTQLKLALYWNSWYGDMFYFAILLQCCRRMDSDLSFSNDNRSTIWTA